MSDLNLKKSFRYYYNTLKYGTYVGVKPTEETTKKIMDIVKKVKPDNPIKEEDIHVTLMYSLGKGDPNFEPYDDILYTAKAMKFELFGDDKNILVIRLESDDLQGRHDQLQENGFVYPYMGYKPHVTISYNYEGELPDGDILREDEEPIELQFNEEYAEPIESDWA